MNKFTNILTKALCAMMIVGITLSGNIGVSAADADSATGDLSREIEILKLFDIAESTISAETLDENTTISRADFAQYMARMLNISAVGSETLYYNDVAPTYFAFDEITALTAGGYMSGVGDKLFRPNEKMQIEHAYKIFAKALGFGGIESITSDISESRNICSKLGVLDNVTQTSGDFKLVNLLKMIYNTLYAECYETNGTDVTKSNETFMEVSRNAEYIKSGKVTCIGGMDINGADVNEDVVIIDSVRYNAPNFDMDECLGRDVEFIYKKASRNEQNKGTIIWIEPISSDDTLNISADPDCTFDKNSGKLSYTEQNGREKSVYIPQNITMIYNGRYRKNDVFDVFSHKRYELTLIKTNGVYSTAIVWEYRNIVADSISTLDKSVKDKITKNSVSLNESDYDKLLIIDSDGASATFESVKRGDVLSVYESYDGKYAKIYISNTQISEKLNVVNISDRKVKIGDEVLEFYDGDAKTKFNDINRYLGQKITVLLDIKGYIADYEVTSGTNMNVGFLINYSVDEGIGASLKLKVLASDGKIAYLDCADTFRINDSKFSENVGDACKLLKGSSATAAQMIGYSTNSDGKITRIYTAKENGDNTSQLIINKRIVKRDTDTSQYDYSYYTESSGRLGRLMAVGPDTKIFIVPDDAAVGSAEDKYFRVGSLSEGVYENAISYRTTSQPEFFEEYILIRLNSATGTKISDWAAMYDYSYETLDSEGNNITKVKMFTYEGAALEVEVDDDFDFKSKGYERGDVFRYGLNEMTGKLASTETVYQPSANIVNPIGENTSEHRTLCGYLNKAYTGGIEIGYEWGGTVDEVLNMNAVGLTRVVIYDREKDEITLGTTSDLKPFSDYGKDCSAIIAGTNWQRLMHVFAHR